MQTPPPLIAQKSTPGAGSFCIPKRAAEILFERNARASAICAYLIVAAYTDAGGTTSTAGLGAIRKRLGCRESVAEKLAAELVAIGLIRDLRSEKGSRSAQRIEERFEVLTFGESFATSIWFGRNLVDLSVRGTDGALSPLSKLNDMRVECILALMWLHSLQQSEWVSVSPPLPTEDQQGIFRRYVQIEDEHVVERDHQIQVVEGGELTLHCCPKLIKRFGWEAIHSAIEHLKQYQFIYEVVIAYNRPLQSLEGRPEEETYVDPESRPLFHVHGGGVSSGLPADELGVSHLTLELAKQIDAKVLYDDELERQRRFVVVSDASLRIGVAGVIRLRYRVKNAKSRGVGWSWKTLMATESGYRKWLNRLLHDHYGIVPERFAQHLQFEAKREALFSRSSSTQVESKNTARKV